MYKNSYTDLLTDISVQINHKWEHMHGTYSIALVFF